MAVGQLGAHIVAAVTTDQKPGQKRHIAAGPAVALGLVERIGEPDGVTTTGQRATPSGERYAEMRNRELAKFLVESISSGITQGTLSFFMEPTP